MAPDRSVLGEKFATTRDIGTVLGMIKGMK